MIRIARVFAGVAGLAGSLGAQSPAAKSTIGPVHGAFADSLRATPESTWLGLQRSAESMHVAMASLAPSGDADVDFVRLMLLHHQAAVEMARIRLAHGGDRQIQRLAQEIVTDQQSEIELMRLWLTQHAHAELK